MKRGLLPSWLRHGLLVQVGLLLLLLAAGAALVPGFASIEVRDGTLYGAPVDILRNAAPTMLLAVGMTLVIASGAIDLSVGSVMALAGTIAALAVNAGQPLPVALASGLFAGMLVGVFNGVIIAWGRLPPIVATLLTLIAARGLAQTLTGDQKVAVSDPTWAWLARGAVLGVPVALVLALVVACVAWLILRRCVIGVQLEAMGANPTAARYAGIPVRGNTVLVMAFSGLCAAAAGLIVTGDTQQADVAGAGLFAELDAILAVVLGGTALTGGRAGLGGALVGALIMRTITVLLQMKGVPTEHTLLLKGLVVLVACGGQLPWLLRDSLARAGGGTADELGPLLRRPLLPLVTGLAALAALLVIASLRYPGFLSAGVVANLLADNAWLGIVAIGMTIVVLSGGIDLSVGAVMSLASVLIAWLITVRGWPVGLAIAFTLAATSLFGVAMGVLIHVTRLPAFIVTLAGMFCARGLGFIISLEPIAITHPGHSQLASAGLAMGTFKLAMPALLLLAVTLAAWFMLRHTVVGRWILALGGSEEASRLAGVPVLLVRAAAYGFCGLCAGLAGAALTFYLSSGSHFEGVGLELDALAAVVIGGTLLRGGIGSVWGTLIGTLTIGVVMLCVTTYETTPLGSGATRVLIAAMLLGFVTLQWAAAGALARAR